MAENRLVRRLIVGAAGSANGFGTIRSARDRYGDSVFVIAIDTNRRELVAASVLADAFVRVPPARARDFPEALDAVAAAFPECDYLPIHDEEIEVATRLARDGALPRTLRLVAPSYEVVRLCHDKLATHRWLEARGLPTPRTAPADPAALARIGPGAILKPREGYAGRDAPAIREPAELAGIAADDWLLQEPLRAPEVAVDVFLSRDGRSFRCACREYIERRGTVATKIRIYHDPVLAAVAERLARELPLPGTFMFQAMQDSAQRWRIIDVNPRVGSGTRMSAAVGMDFAAANLGDFWGEPAAERLRPIAGEHYVVRQYEEYVTAGSR
jgi:carbamoyl-phosphate synthase large subunit